MTEEERLKVLQTLAQGHLSVGQLIIENSGTNNYYDNRAVAGDGSTKTEEAIKRAVVRLMDEKDEKDDYIVYDQDQFYGIKAVLVSPLCGLPQKPAAFATALRNLGIDCLRIPYVYESIRKIHPHQLPSNVELWHQFLNTADEYSLKQVRPAVRLMQLLEEEM